MFLALFFNSYLKSTMVWRLLVLLTCISSVVTWQRQFASWNCQTTSARLYFISYNDLGKGNVVIHSKWFSRISLLDYIPMWAHFTTADSAVLYYSAGTTVPPVMKISIITQYFISFCFQRVGKGAPLGRNQGRFPTGTSSAGILGERRIRPDKTWSLRSPSVLPWPPCSLLCNTTGYVWRVFIHISTPRTGAHGIPQSLECCPSIQCLFGQRLTSGW